MRVLVCGGRDFNDRERVFRTLDEIDSSCRIEFVIQGGAHGADELAHLWAQERKRACATFHAHWDTMKKPAGHARNSWMLEFGEPDLVVAFPGGVGTRGMIAKSRAKHVEVLEA